MADFEFIKNTVSGKWVISAPRRSKRTNVEKKAAVCPFCPGQEVNEEELYRVPFVILNERERFQIDSSALPQNDNNWYIRVVKNKFPFAPNHEIIIHSPDHHKNFDELPLEQVELILQTYRERFNFHKKGGAGLPCRLPAGRQGRQVYIFNNSGPASGASLGHPHTQLVVVPNNVKLDITPLDQEIYSVSENSEHSVSQKIRQADGQKIRSTEELSFPSIPETLETEYFLIFCPVTSEWPDEVWVAPRQNGGGFGFIKDPEITDLSFVLSRLIQIFDLRHGSEFPFNFYIPPFKNWYLRLIPRVKILGGFELGTNISVNTQNPSETFQFIREHFWQPDHEKIKKEHQAEYRKRV